jgi:putative Ca2+/H+ antiporter (TMEM165/GDT1 family)
MRNTYVARPGRRMDFKLFATVFMTIFVAELGDKTQLATLLYASDASHPRMTIFAASAAALIATSAIAVLAGSVVADHVDPKVVRWFAGLGFVAVGIWILLARD